MPNTEELFQFKLTELNIIILPFPNMGCIVEITIFTAVHSLVIDVRCQSYENCDHSLIFKNVRM